MCTVFRSHECIQSFGMTGYVENSQFDAEECMTHVINLFCPQIDNINHPNRNKIALIVTNNEINCIGLHYTSLNFLNLMQKILSNLKWKA